MSTGSGAPAAPGSEGAALSLVSPDEHKLLVDIQRVLRREIPLHTVAGFEPRPGTAAAPESRRPANGVPPEPRRGQRRPWRGDRRTSQPG